MTDQRFNPAEAKHTPGYQCMDMEFLDEKITKAYSRSPGLKFDAEKLPLGLLSTEWLNGVAQVLAFGAKKYAAHNWRKGIQQQRLIDACLRHMLAYNAGEDNDPETGLPHPWHASCCLMFLSELRVTRPDLDDRYKPEEIAVDTQEKPRPKSKDKAASELEVPGVNNKKGRKK